MPARKKRLMNIIPIASTQTIKRSKSPGKQSLLPATPNSDPAINVVPAPTTQAEFKQLARQINACNRKCLNARDRAVENAIKAGMCLQAAKDALGHGKFRQWIDKHCDFSPRQGNRYMQIARQYAEGIVNETRASHLPSQRAVLTLLTDERKTKARLSISERPAEKADAPEDARKSRREGESAAAVLDAQTKPNAGPKRTRQLPERSDACGPPANGNGPTLETPNIANRVEACELGAQEAPVAELADIAPDLLAAVEGDAGQLAFEISEAIEDAANQYCRRQKSMTCSKSDVQRAIAAIVRRTLATYSPAEPPPPRPRPSRRGRRKAADHA